MSEEKDIYGFEVHRTATRNWLPEKEVHERIREDCDRILELERECSSLRRDMEHHRSISKERLEAIKRNNHEMEKS